MYDEKDLKKLFARAVEIQNRSTGTDAIIGSPEKLSLEEIEEIAKESGLSPEYIRQAAVELDGVFIDEPFFLDTENHHEIEILGFATGKPDQKTWEELRSIIEQEFGTPGFVKRTDKIKWEAKPTGIFKFLKTSRSPVVEIKTSGNQSSIRIRKSLKTQSKLLYPAYAAIGASLILFSIMLESNDVSIFFAIAFFLGISRLFFNGYNKIKTGAKDKLRETMAQLQTIITRRYTALENRLHQPEISAEETSDTLGEPSPSPRKKVR